MTEFHKNYRIFRREIVDMNLKNRSAHRRHFFNSCEESTKLNDLRRQIRNFREHVAGQAQSLLAASPGASPYVLRALGLPEKLLYVPGNLAWLRKLMWAMPIRLNLERARRLLLLVKTFEGREYIFKQMIDVTLPGKIYYTESLDFVFRNLEPANSYEVFRDIDRFDVYWLKVAYGLGIRSPAEVLKKLSYDRRSGNKHLALILVEERVVTSAEELEWISKPNSYSYQPNFEKRELIEFRKIVRVLLAHGVSRRQVAGATQYHLGHLKSDQLTVNVALLMHMGIHDFSALFQLVGDYLWRTPTEIWQFVVEVLGARSQQHIALFKRMLKSFTVVEDAVGITLKDLGADIYGLSACQSLMLETAEKNTDVVIGKLRLLGNSPYYLDPEQLAHCRTFVKGERDLSQFLDVLVRHGFSDAQAILAFQACYEQMNVETLHALLEIVGGRGEGEEAIVVAEWIRQAASRGYIGSYRYLATALNLASMQQLQQMSKLVHLGEEMLRYLVDEKRLQSLKELLDWYRNRARGVDSLCVWGTLDAADRVLLDHAFDRRNFFALEGNRHCLDTVVCARAEALVPHPGVNSIKEEREAYWEKLNEVKRQERERLPPALQIMLRETGGILLETLFEFTDDFETELSSQLARLLPVLRELRIGQGPTKINISKLEVDAIALVYRTSTSTVRSLWPQIVGYDQHPSRLQLRDSYPMKWVGARHYLKRSLDRKGLYSLVEAARFAERFKPDNFMGMFKACKYLSPRQLKENSANVSTLVRHLGLLLAVVSTDSVAGKWNSLVFEELAELDQDVPVAFERISELRKFFSVILGDALDSSIPKFVQSLEGAEALHLAERLAGKSNSVLGPHDYLFEALKLTYEKVRKVYSAWASKEYAKFVADKSTNTTNHLSAIISKHPAVFFAKEAAGICTRQNIEMWREERHFHLVVFDPKDSRIVAMALLYVEVLPNLHRTRPGLVIRAINPMEETLVMHTSRSIVDAFFEVAVSIADDNGLAFVAFPSDSGMHLMSNHQSIGDYVKERFVKQSTHSSVLDGGEDMSWLEKPQAVDAQFYAYETGQTPVGTVYVVWRGLDDRRAVGWT